MISVGSDLLTTMNSASAATKAHVPKTAVLGVTGMKRKLADLLTAMTGQSLKYFEDVEAATFWLAEDRDCHTELRDASQSRSSTL